MTQLRFAPVIRVSTEQQEKKGESLNTQKTQIKQYVDSIPDGVIPEECWQYSGQESATKKERILWDKLLEDSGKNKFDAIIVCDASRWSRNNQKSLEGLEILRNNKIRFFIGTSEKNLNLPADRMTIGLFTTLNQFNAEEQSRKSLENRIERAKQGIPSVGRLPFGRTWNIKDGWGLNPEKQARIKQAVKRYINGERLEDISTTVGIHKSFLSKIFKNNLGTEWHLSFVNEKVNIKEQVTIKVPALIDDPELLKAIIERSRINTTYVRGNRKNTYLLLGYIFCKRCGSKIQGSTNGHGRFRRYYYHYRLRNEKCGFHGMIPATELENSLLIKLVKTFGDAKKIEEALLKATPNIDKKKDLTKEKEVITKELKKINNERFNIVQKIGKEIITDEEASPNLKELREKKKAYEDRLTAIEDELKAIPDPKSLKKFSNFAVKMTAHISKNPKRIFEKSDKWKRELIEKVFSGTDLAGERLGVYIDNADKKGEFIYELHGRFKPILSKIPIDDSEIIEVFNLDSDNDLDGNLNSIRSNILGI